MERVMTTEAPPLDAAKLIKIYRKIREAKDELSAKFKKEEEALKEQMQQVESLLLEAITSTGGESIRTEYGSATRQIKERFWSTDWDEFKKFALAHNALDLFEQRIAQKNMATFLKENPTKIPAGLQVDRRYSVLVVKPRSKPE
jgi:DNA-binding ferritin-like protein (Dps family)